MRCQRLRVPPRPGYHWGIDCYRTAVWRLVSGRPRQAYSVCGLCLAPILTALTSRGLVLVRRA